ncbi:hypothetical protein JOM56_006131 [Amanita muscaria]
MPKSAKRKKEKAADFTKAKLKLGKKQTPSNVVDTSFKARSVALPNQSITVDKNEDIPTTKRKLTFDDLIVHLRHYNTTTRKDAILGMRELLDVHWSLLQVHLVALLNGLMRLISDEDVGVRKTLISFISWLLPRIPPEDLIPHSSLLLLYTTSAQTHIFPEIRIDAIRILNILLECIPESVTADWCQVNGGHGNRVLDGYLGILNAGTPYNESEGPTLATSTSSVVLSQPSKLVVLQSLSNFLRAGLSKLQPGGAAADDTLGTLSFWFLSDAFQSAEAFHAFDSLLRPTPSSEAIRTWSAEAHLSDDNFVRSFHDSNITENSSWSLDQLSHGYDSLDQVPDDQATDAIDYDHLSRLTRNLQSILVSTFLDSAPTVFSPSGSPSETSLYLVLAVSQIAQTLYSTLLQRRSFPASVKLMDDLGALLGYMATYFPFKSNSKSGIKVEQAFQELNVIFCQLVALQKFTTENKTSEIAKDKQKSKGSDWWVSLVSSHIIGLLRGESVSTEVGRSLTASAYVSLVPAIWFLAEQRCEIIEALIDHGIKTPSKSATKQPSIGFISRLALLDTEPNYRGSFRVGRSTEIENKFEQWLLHLPQVLWELGATNFPMTEVILRTLLRLLQRKPRLLHGETATVLASKLVPFFCTNHAVRGQLPGPYTKIPSTSGLRRLALDVVATLLKTHSHDLAGNITRLPMMVDVTVRETSKQDYWSHIKTNI